jgi:helix-turn-helix protein
MMSSRRLVLVNAAAKTVVPLPLVDDVAIGRVPERVADLFDDTVLVGYGNDEVRRTVIVGSDTEDIDQFAGLLYRAIVDGRRAAIRYAVREGGRLDDSVPVRDCRVGLDVDAGTATFTDGDWSATLSAGDVSYVRWVDRAIHGEDRTVLSLEHVEDGTALTTELWLPSPRQLNVLGRFLRQQFAGAATSASAIDIDDDDLEVLVTVHTLGADADETLGAEEETAARRDALVDAGLLERGPTGLQMTAEGHVLLNRHFESVNR